jgi:undecaprenyl diphosphate synthase
MHVAIIMDGNGRWATSRGLPRIAGHRAGGRAVEAITTAALEADIDILTLYAFSADNWHRPGGEVRALLQLFEQHLNREADRCIEHGVRVTVIGRRDRLPGSLTSAIHRAECVTRCGSRLHLRLAVDYSARQAILLAARNTPGASSYGCERFAAAVRSGRGVPAHVPDVDLLIRTGGEYRLSDFLLWECAYAELYFTPVMWPDFDADALGAALAEFATRDRRFGRIPPGADDATDTAVGSSRS